jgi:hypothetical protein
MHAARAPAPGSGKSYLWDLVAAIAIGQPMPVIAAGRDEEETEKRLGAALMAGRPLISIDNVNGELGGDALCQLIERPVVEVRILGKSEVVRIEARSTFFCTRNNVILLGDLCRRVITVTLDPMLERPENRVFAGDPMETILEARGAYVAAALTICRAYFIAGRPDRAPRLASFEGWSDTVRSALMWLGEGDPISTMESARAEDPELNRLRELLRSWRVAFGDHETTLQNVIDTAKQYHLRDNEQVLAWPELNAAVRAIADRRGELDVGVFGHCARGFKGRIVDGHRLANRSKPGVTTKWWVEAMVGSVPIPQVAPPIDIPF